MPDFSTYAWNQLAPASSPDARWGHAMVWDGSRIVMFGGGTASALGTANLSDTWEFDGTTWTDLSPATTPPARRHHSMVWDGSRVLMFGGATNTTGATGTTDLWEFTGGDWNDITSSGPTARMRATMVWDGTRVILYGGQSGSGVKKDTWKYETGAWTQLTPTNYIGNIRGAGFTNPLNDGRAGMPAIWDSARVVAFSGFSDAGGGGEFQTSPFFEGGGGTWQYATADWTQDGPATNPAARWGQGFCVTDDDQKTLMFGGNVSYVGGFGDAFNSDTWEYDGTDWNQLAVSGPGAREVPMVWDDVAARGLIFGGRKAVSGADVALDETWEFATTVAPAETIKAINNTFGLG